MLVRRGWRLALRSTSFRWPLATRSGFSRSVAPTARSVTFDAGDVVRFVATGLRATFGALGPFAAFGVVLAIVLVGGFGSR